VTDNNISHTGDDVAILMTHTQGVGNEAIHKLAWNAFYMTSYTNFLWRWAAFGSTRSFRQAQSSPSTLRTIVTGQCSCGRVYGSGLEPLPERFEVGFFCGSAASRSRKPTKTEPSNTAGCPAPSQPRLAE